MTFNVYRTTKGRVGEPVYAEIEVDQPRAPASTYRDIFPIREYYTNKQAIPSRAPGRLARATSRSRSAASARRSTSAWPRATSYILAESGNFGANFMKGLFGVWLQAMVLTAIGVFAGTFLSWPVALLTTIAFFVAGQVAFALPARTSRRQSLLGGGPFESLIRLLSHDNQMTRAGADAGGRHGQDARLAGHAGHVAAGLHRAELRGARRQQHGRRRVRRHAGACWSSNLLLALAYALPFSIAGYFILKNREVAA